MHTCMKKKRERESSLLHKQEMHDILSRKNFIYLGASYSTLIFSEWPFCLFLFLWIDLSYEKKPRLNPFWDSGVRGGIVVLDFLKRANFKNLWYLKFLCYELSIMFFSLEMHFRTWYHSYLHHFSTHQPFRVVCMCIVCLSACVAGPTSS